ncbi:MAG: SDR family NAD(P)-dependent oxidoreductase [Azospirillaceae bacterium]
MPAGSGGEARPLAVITWATSGIGAGFARIAAEAGYDLILTGLERAPNSLPIPRRDQKIAYEAADLACFDDLSRLIGRLDTAAAPAVLVNCAGIGWCGRYDEQDPAVIERLIALNIAATCHLTRAVLPRMLARGRGGRILNVASISAAQPNPLMSLYGASKAFVLSFTRALQAEVRRSGVTVSALCPGPVDTPFIDQAGGRDTALFGGRVLPLMEADHVARIGWRGMMDGREVIVPGLRNQLVMLARGLLPVRLRTSAAKRLLRGRG